MDSSQLSSQTRCEPTASPDSLGWGSRTQRDSVSEGAALKGFAKGSGGIKGLEIGEGRGLGSSLAIS